MKNYWTFNKFLAFIAKCFPEICFHFLSCGYYGQLTELLSYVRFELANFWYKVETFDSRERENYLNSSNIRWIQRFSNYKKALEQLEDAVVLYRTRPLSPLEEQGLIQGFEYTYELAWNTLKDFLQEQGNSAVYGPRDAIQEAFKSGLIVDGELWMAMFKDRNKTSYTYNRATAVEIVQAIISSYFGLFQTLKTTLEQLIL